MADAVVACGLLGCGECLLELSKDFRLDAVEEPAVLVGDGIKVQSGSSHLEGPSRLSWVQMRGTRAC